MSKDAKPHDRGGAGPARPGANRATSSTRGLESADSSRPASDATLRAPVKVFHHDRYNIDLGLLNRLHPFDGRKFRRVRERVEGRPGVELVQVAAPVERERIDAFVTPSQRANLAGKRYVLRALEAPWLPLPLSWIDRRILEPMRWGVAGTLAAAEAALAGERRCWNLSGGYHHASRQSSEGFCIYNDIGIAVQALRESGRLAPQHRVLIIDVDAHHGNGNAQVFMDDPSVTILDIYNSQTYPRSPRTWDRVDIDLPLRRGTAVRQYLDRLCEGLDRLPADARLAFVVAGTDVLHTDPLGGLLLTADDCVARDEIVLGHLASLGVPAVVVGGGGYGPESVDAIAQSILVNARETR